MKRYCSIISLFFAFGCTKPTTINFPAVESKAEVRSEIAKTETVIIDSVKFTKDITSEKCYYISNTLEINNKKFNIKIDCEDVTSFKERLTNRLKKIYNAISE